MLLPVAGLRGAVFPQLEAVRRSVFGCPAAIYFRVSRYLQARMVFMLLSILSVY